MPTVTQFMIKFCCYVSGPTLAHTKYRPTLHPAVHNDSLPRATPK